MPILLYRVDERLIHGQVVLGWGARLRPSLYLVVDDELASSEWEQELYRLALPEEVSVEFHTVAEARRLLPAWQAGEGGAVLLTRGVESMWALGRDGLLREQSINLGGLHHTPGRERVLPYLHLGPEDFRLLESLEAAGAEVSAQDLPGTPPVPLADLTR